MGRYAVFIGLRPPVSPVAKIIPEHSRAFQCLPRHPSGVEPLVTTVVREYDDGVRARDIAMIREGTV